MKNNFINLITLLLHKKVNIPQCVKFKYTLYLCLNCKSLTQIPPLIHSTKLSPPNGSSDLIAIADYCNKQKHKRWRALLLRSSYNKIKMLILVLTHTPSLVQKSKLQFKILHIFTLSCLEKQI